MGKPESLPFKGRYKRLKTSERRHMHTRLQAHRLKDEEVLAQLRADKKLPQHWAERLAGVMSQFRPGGAQPGSHLSYSPWCVPTVIGGIKCVVVNSQLRDYEPMAWDFVLNFAKDNDLQVGEACLIPEKPAKE